jgi:hypothetical protein
MSLELQVEALLMKSLWQDRRFQLEMTKLADAFNGASAIADICSAFGIEDERFANFEKRPLSVALYASSDDVVAPKIGPPKSADRALVKMQGGKTLKDLNRVRKRSERKTDLITMVRRGGLL